MWRAFRWLRGLLSDWIGIDDLHIYGGTAALCYGLYQIAPCYAWISGGLVLLLLGVRPPPG